MEPIRLYRCSQGIQSPLRNPRAGRRPGRKGASLTGAGSVHHRGRRFLLLPMMGEFGPSGGIRCLTYEFTPGDLCFLSAPGAFVSAEHYGESQAEMRLKLLAKAEQAVRAVLAMIEAARIADDAPVCEGII